MSAAFVCVASVFAQDAVPPVPKAPGVIHIAVDAAADRHSISPLIYGVGFGTTQQLQDLNTPVNRSGGDSASTYSWQMEARASGRDWFFESTPTSKDIMDQFGDNFVALTHRGGARAMMTVPMLGWIARLGPDHNKLAAFSITKYGLQQKTDAQGFAEAGNGILLSGANVKNNPNDAAMPDSAGNEDARLRHMVQQWKPASAGGVQFWLLDNEPARWHDIHRDVHPLGTHASELLQKTLAASAMVRAADPSAKIVAPEEWLPGGFYDSGFDQQLREINDKATPTDRVRETGGMDMLPWLMTQWKKAGKPVDVISVHFYPQQGEYSDDVSEKVQLSRNRSTRLLWDRQYQDKSWMGGNIALLPHLREWVDRFYFPGTPIAVTEYNWGGEKSMNGATAQADILGIFGRENLYMATRWIAPAEGTPTLLAMKMYRNYDGHGAGFGDTSVSAIVPDADTVSAFAALRGADNALTVMVINKQLKEPAPVELDLSHFSDMGVTDAVQLADGKLVKMPIGQFQRGTLQSVLPPQSVTLYILHTHAN